MAGFHKAFRNVTTIESEDGSTFVFLGLMYIYIYIYRKIIPWLKNRKLWLTKAGEPPFLPVQSVFLIVKSTFLLAKSPLFIQQHQNFTD
jgi:hypothetical protein